MATKRKTFLAALSAAVAIAAAAPAAAQGVQTQFTIARIDRLTPKCRDRPGAPVIGRVSGIITGVPTRGVSFAGCFDSFEECERWRIPVSGVISGRINYNRCEPR